MNTKQSSEQSSEQLPRYLVRWDVSHFVDNLLGKSTRIKLIGFENGKLVELFRTTCYNVSDNKNLLKHIIEQDFIDKGYVWIHHNLTSLI